VRKNEGQERTEAGKNNRRSQKKSGSGSATKDPNGVRCAEQGVVLRGLFVPEPEPVPDFFCLSRASVPRNSFIRVVNYPDPGASCAKENVRAVNPAGRPGK
jgi:hypothetical protein